MSKDVIVALDFPSKEETLAFLDKFTGRKKREGIRFFWI